MQIQENPEINQMQTENQQNEMTNQRKPGRNAHISNSNYQEGMALSGPACMSIHLHSFPS